MAKHQAGEPVLLPAWRAVLESVDDPNGLVGRHAAPKGSAPDVAREVVQVPVLRGRRVELTLSKNVAPSYSDVSLTRASSAVTGHGNSCGGAAPRAFVRKADLSRHEAL